MAKTKSKIHVTQEQIDKVMELSSRRYSGAEVVAATGLTYHVVRRIRKENKYQYVPKNKKEMADIGTTVNVVTTRCQTCRMLITSKECVYCSVKSRRVLEVKRRVEKYVGNYMMQIRVIEGREPCSGSTNKRRSPLSTITYGPAQTTHVSTCPLVPASPTL